MGIFDIFCRLSRKRMSAANQVNSAASAKDNTPAIKESETRVVTSIKFDDKSNIKELASTVNVEPCVSEHGNTVTIEAQFLVDAIREAYKRYFSEHELSKANIVEAGIYEVVYTTAIGGEHYHLRSKAEEMVPSPSVFKGIYSIQSKAVKYIEEARTKDEAIEKSISRILKEYSVLIKSDLKTYATEIVKRKKFEVEVTIPDFVQLTNVVSKKNAVIEIQISNLDSKRVVSSDMPREEWDKFVKGFLLVLSTKNGVRELISQLDITKAVINSILYCECEYPIGHYSPLQNSSVAILSRLVNTVAESKDYMDYYCPRCGKKVGQFHDRY